MIFVISLFGTMAVLGLVVLLRYKVFHGARDPYMITIVTVVLTVLGLVCFAAAGQSLYANGRLLTTLSVLGGVTAASFIVIFPTAKYAIRQRKALN